MKKQLLLLFLIPIISAAQVGINTITPNAMLDIQSTNNGILIPRVQLSNALDITNVVNPAGGALPTSTLIYNMAAAGLAPNNVNSGFYFWNGSRWMPMTNAADQDWHEQGTTTPPDAITDAMFHMGNVAIGKNTANTTLDVETINQNTGIHNNFIKNSSSGTSYSIDNTTTVNDNDDAYGMRNSLLGTGTGAKIGLANFSAPSTLGPKTGISNDFIGNSSDAVSGVSNVLVHNDSGNSFGILNNLTNPAGSTGVAYGIRNNFDNNSTTALFGVSNEINANSGTGGSYGISNTIQGGKIGGKIGVTNNITSSVPDTMMGISNYITSTVDGGGLIGLENVINANSDTPISGNLNQLGGTGNSNVNGVYSFITNTGNGNHTGILSSLNGTGTGRKYGTFTTIDPAAGGEHYGIFSRVLKAGANYAGYFNGKVAIGTNISAGIDDYVFPAARGTNNQIMQTDGIGNLTWRNPNFWSLNGNAGTNVSTLFGNTFTATDNFIGTTDNVDLMLGTNNTPRLKIAASGNIGIGADNPTAKFHIFDTSYYVSCYISKSNVANGFSGYVSPTFIVATSSTLSAAADRNYSSQVISIGNNIGTNIAGYFRAQQAANNYAIIVPADSGDVGFGIESPSTKLHVVKATSGALRIEDGTQANGNVLRSDANGVGTWQNPNTFSWSLNGNNVNAATQFLGSTNDADVVFRRNSVRAGYIGQYNTAYGISALPATTGVYNVAIGVNALASLGLADQNCALGWNALSTVTTGGNNIGIGTNAQVPTATANNQVRIGNTNIGYAGIQVGWSITSDSRWKDNIQSSDLGLDFINHLRPVSYTRKNDAAKKTEYGFIAQELDQTLNEFGATNNGIITKDDAGMLSVRYNDLLAPIVKAIQELKAENDTLKEQNAALNNRLKSLENKQ